MEQKNRGRTVLCAASHRFHTLLKLPLPGQFFFSFPICSFLSSAAGRLRRHGLDGDFDRRLAKFWRRGKISRAWKVDTVQRQLHTDKMFVRLCQNKWNYTGFEKWARNVK